MSAPRWVLHLPTTLTSLEAAIELVEHLRDTLAHVPAIDFHRATLTEKDRMMVRHQVFCDLRPPGREPCGLRHDHDGPCVVVPELLPACQ